MIQFQKGDFVERIKPTKDNLLEEGRIYILEKLCSCIDGICVINLDGTKPAPGIICWRGNGFRNLSR